MPFGSELPPRPGTCPPEHRKSAAAAMRGELEDIIRRLDRYAAQASNELGAEQTAKALKTAALTVGIAVKRLEGVS